MKKGEEEVEVPEEDEATTGEASTNDFTDDGATFTDDGATTDTSETMVTPVKNLMKSFESMETPGPVALQYANQALPEIQCWIWLMEQPSVCCSI